MADSIKFGVIGLKFGLYHVKTLANLNGGSVVAVADRSNPNLEAVAERYGCQAFKDGRDLINDADLDAVIIATSPKPRAVLLEAAVQRELPAFVEKPWATNLKHARELAATCEGARAPIMPAFSFRYHAAIAKLRELMDGDLGANRLLNGSYIFRHLPPAEGWLWDTENGGGFFNENSCHLFDAVFHLAGPPVEVYAAGGRFEGRPSEDNAAITVKFDNGGMGVMTVGGIGQGGFQDYPAMDLITEKGRAHLKGRHHMWEELEWSTGGTVESLTAPVEILDNTRYVNALTHFVHCIREGDTPSATVEQAVLVNAFTDALYAAIRTGQPQAVEPA